MLRLNRYIALLLVGTIVQSSVLAQSKNATPRSVTDLFNDLPVHDASAGSVLHERESAAEKITNNIFITTSLNTHLCFVGEPVLFTGTLYSALQSHSVIQTAPALPGFVATEMAIDNDKPQYKTIAGKNCRVFIIRRLQLLPVQEGAITIAPMVVNNTVHYTDESNHAQTYSGTVHSDPVKLIVKPLPRKGRPAAFSGLVGDFSMVVTLQRTLVFAGEADTLHIAIAGSGNFTDCKLPTIKWPDSVEHFPAKDQLTLDDSRFPFTGNKTFDIPFVVSTPGKGVMPAISLAYFDPATALYKTITSTAIAINVLPAVREKRLTPLVKASKNNYSWLWFSVVALLITMTAVYFIKKRSNKIKEVPDQTTDMAFVPVDYTGMIHDLQAVQSVEQYGVAFKNILYTFIEQELGITRKAEETWVNELYQQQSPLAGDVRQLLAMCNQLLYSPGNINEKMKQEIEAQLERIIKKVSLI